MNNLKDIFAAGGGGFIADGFFVLVFSLLAVHSFTALLNHIRLEMEARHVFAERKNLLQTLFGNYDKRVKELQEEARRKEEARLAREQEG